MATDRLGGSCVTEENHLEVIEQIMETVTTCFMPMAERFVEGARDQSEKLVLLIPMVLGLIGMQDDEKRTEIGIEVLFTLAEVARIAQQQIASAESDVQAHIEEWNARFPEFATTKTEEE